MKYAQWQVLACVMEVCVVTGRVGERCYNKVEKKLKGGAEP